MSAHSAISGPTPILPPASRFVPPQAVLPLVEARGYARLVAMNAMFDATPPPVGEDAAAVHGFAPTEDMG